MNAERTVTIGKNATCDLCLDHASVSGLHAQARLDPGHFMWIRDEHSARGLHLKRNDGWTRVRLVSACAGDRLRFGDVEVELDQITALFGADADVRLAKTPAGSLFDTRTGRYKLRNPDDEPTLNNPKRNASTGELEDGEE
ncbi:MAG: FHA domain-containing protein [Pseudomonadota bacterium]